MNIDWFTFVAQIINFAILIALLNHFLYRPITEAITKRQSEIDNQLDQAQQRETEANEAKSKYENLNHEIESQRQMLLERANEETDAARKRLMQEARNDVQFRREDWMAALRREQDSIIQRLVEKSGDQVVAISSKTLEQLADEKTETRVVERFLDHLRSIPTEEAKKLKAEIQNDPAIRIETAFEISKDSQQQVREALQQQLSLKEIQFIVKPELVMGINLRVGGVKIGWNVREYLDTLQEKLERVMES